MANKSTPREIGTIAPEDRDSYVYCKGCGTPLESRARLSKPRAVVNAMMCEACQEKHGHALMPAPGAPTFCYRCGTPEEVFIAPGISPATYHVCPRCLPERYEHYGAGNFDIEPAKPAVEDPKVQPADGAKAPAADSTKPQEKKTG